MYINSQSLMMRGLAVLLLMSAAPAAAERDPRAESVLRTAAEAMRLDALKSRGGIVVTAEGQRDLRARYQGMQHEHSEPYPLNEVTAIDLTDGEVMLETRGRINPDAEEWLRYAFDAEGRNLLMDRLAGRGFWIGRDEAGSASRMRQRVPHVLLASAMAAEDLTHEGDAQGSPRVSFQAPSGERISLGFSDSGYLTEASYLIDMPLRGDVRVSWRFEGYRDFQGIPYPSAYSVRLNGDDYVQANIGEVRLGPVDWAELTRVGFEIPAPPAAEAESGGGASGGAGKPSLPTPREVGEGVWIVPNIRGGFHPLVVEFADFMAVVDAPAGWFELDGLPAYNFVPGGSSATGERLLATVRALRPDKPVRYVVLTHHHSDHIGGIRPFIAAGAMIVASPQTAEMVRFAASQPHEGNPDALSGSGVPPKIEVVRGTASIGDGRRELRAINVGDNPHAHGMLVAYLADQKLLFQSDLFEPSSPANFPNPARVPVMKWFVDWLDRSGLETEQIRAIHGASLVTPDHLAAIRRLDRGSAD